MNNTFFNELRRCCNEMYSDRENSEKISKVIEAYDRAISFSDTARKEGLLALEEASEGLVLNDVKIMTTTAFNLNQLAIQLIQK